ncbi:MAG: DUF4159 domain-containing protein [Acidobacteriota bacterium]|nr:DUF4159 domain-containing protein [Acidobacteriota bacterium]
MTGIVALAVLSLSPVTAAAAPEGSKSEIPAPPTLKLPPGQHVTFVRVEYDSVGGYGEAYYYYDGRYWLRWETDFPQADQNFIHRFEELTTTHPHLNAVTRRLSDPDLLDFPFLYMCDVGWMSLSDDESAKLRDDLLKGGFLWVDDFWGWAEWRNLELVFKNVFPNRPWQDIPNDHPLLKLVYPLEETPQVPARDFAYLGHDEPYIHRQPAVSMTPVQFRGIFDDDGRLMAVATHNTDIGDGWEREAYGEWYFETYSTIAYAMGVNIIIWALSN